MKFIHFASAVLTVVILANPVVARLGMVSHAMGTEKLGDRILVITLTSCTIDQDCPDGQRCGETHEILQERICEDIPLLTAGSVCIADEQCDTGFCINGVCPKECMCTDDCTGTAGLLGTTARDTIRRRGAETTDWDHARRLQEA